jgi:hypothetical protein
LQLLLDQHFSISIRDPVLFVCPDSTLPTPTGFPTRAMSKSLTPATPHEIPRSPASFPHAKTPLAKIAGNCASPDKISALPILAVVVRFHGYGGSIG